MNPVILGAVVIVFLVIYIRNRSTSKYPQPPGPPGLPLIGNLLSLPKERPWVQMEKWSREYGPIYRLQLGSRNFIVLGTAKAAYDLLDKRSAIYSSRPRQIMTSELVSRGLRMTFMQYTDLWKRERKLLHQLTQPKAAASYEPIQDAESAWLLKDLLENPNDAWGHGQRYAGSTIMQIAFNKRALKHTDRAITEMRRVNDLMARTAVPGAYLVDSFPLINYLPKFLAPWKREADEIFEDTLELFRSHVNDVRQNVAQGKDQHCFAKYILELQAEYGLSEPEATFLAGAMYGAGSDTTSDMISTFIFCMAYRPDVVDKAHEELDRVIGQDRMPDFPDENSLPYVQAVIQECLRWRSVIAGGLAHASIEDDVYEGYFIPKGSTVLACHWSIHMDPDTFPQPEKFLPERFIQDGKFSDHGTVAFGLGRRKCPGQWIAERSLFIVFSRILWAFKIGPEFDASGKKYPLDPDAFTPGFSSHPQHFQCRIEPRGDWVKEIIYQAIEKQNVGEL